MGHFQGEGIGHLDEGGEFLEGDRAIGVHEAVVADLHEASWEDVLKETPDELQDLKREGS